MKGKLKRILITLTVAILVCSCAFLLWVIYMSSSSIMSRNTMDYSDDATEMEELELVIWRQRAELEYLDRYCELKALLPSDEEDTQIISVEVQYHENRAELMTIYHPFLQKTKVYEMGVVTQSSDDSLEIKGLEMRLYRIELVDEPEIYIEYVSHIDDAFFYLTRYNQDAEFLLYPLLSRHRDIVNNEIFIEII